MPLEFKAEEDGKTITLSEGQRVMLRAGWTKLKILEEAFSIAQKKELKVFYISEKFNNKQYLGKLGS